jgi:hypothetical protein
MSLLTCFEYPPLCQRDSFTQNIYIADVIGENEHQRGIEIGALPIAETAVGFDDQPIGGISIGEIRRR